MEGLQQWRIVFIAGRTRRESWALRGNYRIILEASVVK